MRSSYLSAAGGVGVVVVAAAAAFFSMEAALAVVLLGLAAAAANRFPPAAVAFGVAVVALVPVYWVPDIPGTRVAMNAVIFVCIALAPIAVIYRHALRLGFIDWLVILYVLLTSLSYFINTESGVGPTAGVVFSVALPYATFRLIGLWPRASTVAGVGVVLAGVVSAVIAIREYQGWWNPFFRYFRGGHEHAFFAKADFRLGHFRPEATFGHAIALGMFLVLAAVIALGLAWRPNPRIPRPMLYAAVLLILVALANTFVRGPLVMLAFALLILVLRESRRGGPGRGLLVAVAFAVLVNVGAFANVFELRDASEAGGSVQASGDYRIEIWRVVSDSDNFSLLGKEAVDTLGVGFARTIGFDIGIKSFDNAYALIFIGFGALTLLAFVAIGLRIGHAALFAEVSVIDRAWAAAILGAFINLMTVNLLTQFAHIFWIGIGLIAASVQVARLGVPEPVGGVIVAPPELVPSQ